MTTTMQNLLHILGDVLQKKDIPDMDLDMEELYDLATKQGVWHIIFELLKTHYDVSKYEMKFLTVITKNIAANEFVYKTVKKLEENGIECCYLKGITVARFYPAPECRVSGDTDIIIDDKYINESAEILKELGYYVEELRENLHHYQAQHKTGKLLEVHNMLYSKQTRDILFAGECEYNEEWTEVPTSVGNVKTLGINDGLMFLTAHFIKHFLNSNVNLRQMTDLLLYMDYYKNDINWEKYNAFLKKLKYNKLVDTIKAVGNLYFGMDFETEITETDAFLTDFERESESVYEYYCLQKTNMGKVEYLRYMNVNAEKGRLIRRIFPKAEKLAEAGYNNTDKVWGLAYAHCLRFARIAARRTKGRKAYNKQNKEKTDLLKNLEMM